MNCGLSWSSRLSTGCENVIVPDSMSMS